MELNELLNKKVVKCRFCHSLANTVDELICSNEECNESDFDNFYVVIKKNMRAGICGRSGIYNLYDYYTDFMNPKYLGNETFKEAQLRIMDTTLEDR